MGNTRIITVNSVAATEIDTSVACTDLYIGEDPAVSGSSYPSTGLLVSKVSALGPFQGVTPGGVYPFSQKAQGPTRGSQNFPGGPGVYPVGTVLGWVKTVVGSISLFINEEGAS